jgi:hypothetical protein
LVDYRGVAGATASLTNSGSFIRLETNGGSLYERVHDTSVVDTTAYIRNWPAFDATRLYGLDPARQYWLDPVPRPAGTHISDLPAGVSVGTDTIVSPNFALLDLKVPSFDFLDHLWAARIGTTHNGADGLLAYGATAHLQTTTAGGVAQQGIFMHPPYTHGYAGGETFVEWPLSMSQPSIFSFSVGVDDGATCTDGVTFRVVVNGAEAWQQHVLHQGWVQGSLDLSAYVGKELNLRIVTNPGLANNVNCDWASFSQLSLTPLNKTTISVPVALQPGATVTGFSGYGTPTADSSRTLKISDISVPGWFLIAFRPGTPVASGASLTSLPVEVWSGFEGELPAPAAFAGAGTISDVTSGGQSRQRAILGHPPYRGRTILTWMLAIPEEGSLQLNWSAGMQDGSRSKTGVEFSVRINGETYWTLFQKAPVGWNPGTLDLSNWRGQNIVLQLNTSSVGDNYFDWAWWADLTISRR